VLIALPNLSAAVQVYIGSRLTRPVLVSKQRSHRTCPNRFFLVWQSYSIDWESSPQWLLVGIGLSHTGRRINGACKPNFAIVLSKAVSLSRKITTRSYFLDYDQIKILCLGEYNRDHILDLSSKNSFNNVYCCVYNFGSLVLIYYGACQPCHCP